MNDKQQEKKKWTPSSEMNPNKQDDGFLMDFGGKESGIMNPLYWPCLFRDIFKDLFKRFLEKLFKVLLLFYLIIEK